MPNRILHERICVSETIARLTSDEERFFYRLIVQCDDYGRFDGRASVIRARCFALQLDEVADEDVARWLGVLEGVGLVETYTVDGRDFLRVTTWERYQQTRAKRSKFPAPGGGSQESASTCNQVPAYVPVSGIRESRIENRESRIGVETREPHAANGADAPTTPPDEPRASRKSPGKTLPPEHFEPNEADYAAGADLGLARERVASQATAMLDHFRAKGEQRADWHATFRTWIRRSVSFDAPPRASPGGSPNPGQRGGRTPVPTESAAYFSGEYGQILAARSREQHTSEEG